MRLLYRDPRGRQAGGSGLERSIFAERWERLVYNMLYHSKRDDHGGRAVSTVSFRTEDYLPGEAIGHPDS